VISQHRPGRTIRNCNIPLHFLQLACLWLDFKTK